MNKQSGIVLHMFIAMRIQYLISLGLCILLAQVSASAQTDYSTIKIRSRALQDSVYIMDCTGGFGGGNVVASIGEDGILLVDDMLKPMADKLMAAISLLSEKPIKIVVNSHFHGDHIGGNIVFANRSVIIGQEQIANRILLSPGNTSKYPMVTFRDSLRIFFNKEEVRIYHLPNAHSDSDAIIYFSKSKVLHLGDLFFNGMFPAVYKESGGDLNNLVSVLEQILDKYPADAKVVPGHGEAASMEVLKEYVLMLKETIAIVTDNIRKGRALEKIQLDKRFDKYAYLGNGGAQTLPQYVSMLYKLLQNNPGIAH